MKRLTFQIIAGALGIWLSAHFISNVEIRTIPGYSEFFGIEISSDWQIIVLIGIVIGIINSFLKPILKFITTPIRILTFGIASVLLNMFLIWIVDILFLELTIKGIIPLFWTTVFVWISSISVLSFCKK
jgi:putative membrane protein